MKTHTFGGNAGSHHGSDLSPVIQGAQYVTLELVRRVAPNQVELVQQLCEEEACDGSEAFVVFSQDGNFAYTTTRGISDPFRDLHTGACLHASCRCSCMKTWDR